MHIYLALILIALLLFFVISGFEILFNLIKLVVNLIRLPFALIRACLTRGGRP